MRTLLVTDLHFTHKPQGLLEAQKKCILRLLSEEVYDDVIIMGDLMMHRKPTPSVLLALKEVVDKCKRLRKPLTILRGNHDSETKADDGVTSLSMFDYYATVVTHTWFDPKTKRAFIPHYEDEERIKKHLSNVPKGYTVFGHFGYHGSLNSAGDADFGLPLSVFFNTTFLGHIHNHTERTIVHEGSVQTVTILGTPYTTNFGEAYKTSYYAVLDTSYPGRGITEYKELTHGPRHLVGKAEDLTEEALDKINDPEYFTMLRVLVDADHHPIPYDKLNVASIDVKYTPVFDEEELSSYNPERELFSINEMIIEDYVNEANSSIPKDTLMQGYRLLKDED